MTSLNAGTAISAAVTIVSSGAVIGGVARLYQDRREVRRQTIRAHEIISGLSSDAHRESLNRLLRLMHELVGQTSEVMAEMSEGHQEPYRREHEREVFFEGPWQALEVDEMARAVEDLPIETAALIPGAIDQIAAVLDAADRLRVVTSALPAIVEILAGFRRRGSYSYEQEYESYEQVYEFLRRSQLDLGAAIEAVERLIRALT